MSENFDVIIVGAGIFGASTALELQQRGYNVLVLEAGAVPNPLASSTDISKVIRIEYSDDEPYAKLAEQARGRWLALNEQVGATLYHEVGVVMMTRHEMSPGEYEYENYHSLLRRGYQADRLNEGRVRERFPAFNADLYIDGYFHGGAGYVESGRTVRALLSIAEERGVELRENSPVKSLNVSSGKITGVTLNNGDNLSADRVIVAAGVWTPYLLPELQPYLRVIGMPVFHLKPADESLFEPPNFAVFSADVSNSGWYGFPIHPTERVVKIAFHGKGTTIHPINHERTVTNYETEQLRAFLKTSLPPLADAPIVYTRRCLYCDTLDEHFWIDRHPEINGLTVAAGGSGHAYKFGPLIGEWVADAVEGTPDPALSRFQWRDLKPDTRGEEASRYREAL
jgi:glycine/D-amino acid oxidase-like deaminating enzyme